MAAAASASSEEKDRLLHEVSTLLNTGLDQETLKILVRLCDAGINPEALAVVVEQLRLKGAELERETVERMRGSGGNRGMSLG